MRMLRQATKGRGVRGPTSRLDTSRQGFGKVSVLNPRGRAKGLSGRQDNRIRRGTIAVVTNRDGGPKVTPRCMNQALVPVLGGKCE